METPDNIREAEQPVDGTCLLTHSVLCENRRTRHLPVSGKSSAGLWTRFLHWSPEPHAKPCFCLLKDACTLVLTLHPFAEGCVHSGSHPASLC